MWVKERHLGVNICDLSTIKWSGGEKYDFDVSESRAWVRRLIWLKLSGVQFTPKRKNLGGSEWRKN